LQTMQGYLTPIRAYENDTEEKIWLRTNRESNPATRELCVDSIMGMPQSNTKYGYNFGQIMGGLFAQSGVYDRTNHLITNEEPAGGNIGFLDGHCQWRVFDPDIYKNGEAIPRYVPQYGNSPSFFW
jgi:prepilin-type processing-associated H-X9-DG protein